MNTLLPSWIDYHYAQVIVYSTIVWAALCFIVMAMTMAMTTHGTDDITEQGIAIQAVNPCEDIEIECERLRAALAVYTGATT